MAVDIIYSLLGGIIYRWRGSSHSYRPLPQLLFSLPFAVYSPYPLVVFALTFLAVCSGHGRWMSLKHPLTGKPERTEFIIQWLENKLPPYWYKVLGLSLSGMLITLPAGIAALDPFLAVSGILKAVAYMIGWQSKRYQTEIGEFLTGIFLWGVLVFLKDVAIM